MNINDKLEIILNEIIEVSKNTLKNNLNTIIMFGSGNNLTDFIEGLSDLDFIYILENINIDTLKQISFIRESLTNKYNIQIDIKPFTASEFKASLKGKGSFEFFTGWGLKAIKLGEQRCLYDSGKFKLNYNLTEERLKKDSLDRAHYYITKLRKIFYSNKKILLRGEEKQLDEQDKLKLISSSIKNVLVFCLAYKGIFVNSYSDVLKYSKEIFGDVSVIEYLFNLKKKKIYNSEIISDSYNFIEILYKEMIS